MRLLDSRFRLRGRASDPLSVLISRCEHADTPWNDRRRVSRGDRFGRVVRRRGSLIDRCIARISGLLSALSAESGRPVTTLAGSGLTQTVMLCADVPPLCFAELIQLF